MQDEFFVLGYVEGEDGHKELFGFHLLDDCLEAALQKYFPGCKGRNLIETTEDVLKLFSAYQHMVKECPLLGEFGITNDNIDDVIKIVITAPPCANAQYKFFSDLLLKMAIFKRCVVPAFPYADNKLVDNCIKRANRLIQKSKSTSETFYLNQALNLLIHIRQVDANNPATWRY